MIARTPGAVQGIMILAIFPLTFGASTFVPVDTLPSWLQTFTDLNPLTHLVDSLRGLLTGGLVATDVLWTLGWMGALLASSCRWRYAPTDDGRDASRASAASRESARPRS